MATGDWSSDVCSSDLYYLSCPGEPHPSPRTWNQSASWGESVSDRCIVLLSLFFVQEWMHGSVDKEYSTFFGQNILCTRLLSRVLHVGSWLKYAIIKFRVESKSYTLIILDMKTIDFSDIHCTVILDHVEYPSVAPHQWGGLRRRSLW